MPSTLDFDKQFGARIQKNVDTAVVVEFTFGGVKWHATNTASEVALLSLAGGDDPVTYLYQLVVEEEQEQWRQFLVGMRGLDQQVIIDVINTLTEKLASVPTLPPSSSPATSRRTTSGGRSTAGSSSKANRRG